MNEHALAVVTDRDRWAVPLETPIDIAVGATHVCVVGHRLRDVLPVPPGRNPLVALEYVVGVARGDMIRDGVALSAHPSEHKKWVYGPFMAVRLVVPNELVVRTVPESRQIFDCVSN